MEKPSSRRISNASVWIARTGRQVKSTKFFKYWKKSRCVYIPTDKTNYTRVIKIKDYKRWVSDHLLNATDLAIRPKVMDLFEHANTLLEKLKMELLVQEDIFVWQLLATWAILFPKLLINDHKTINEKGALSTRLVIPALKFTVTFFNISYLGIKRCLDKGKVNYSQVSIVQASDLKERLEKLNIKRNEATIASVDTINMYPSIKLATIWKAVIFFARKLTAETNKTINLCLELIHFGMSYTLISFDCEYYEYHGIEREEQWLAIGGFKSAFLAYLVASYLFENAKANYHPTIYHRIYKGYGLVIFKGKMKASKIRDWLEHFQKMVNKAAGNQYLQFTVEIWTKEVNSPTPVKKERFQILTNDKFPFLDMKMIWFPEEDLQFVVFRKKVEQLKYVGKESTHTPSTLCAIPLGVLNHLTKHT